MSTDLSDSSTNGIHPKPSSPLATHKGVTLVEEPEEIGTSPGLNNDDSDVSPTMVGSSGPKHHRASISGKKMTGRPPINTTASSNSLAQQFPGLSIENSDQPEGAKENVSVDPRKLLAQVAEWLHEEKSRRYSHHLHHHHHLGKHLHGHTDETSNHEQTSSHERTSNHEQPPKSLKDEQDLALDKLEKILSAISPSNLRAAPKLATRQSSTLLRKGSIARKFKRGSFAAASSDTEYLGDDVLVPNVEAALDNSRTMAFTGGSATVDTSEASKHKDYQCWVTFKQEIVRLTHTLKLKGWRRFPIEQGAEISVARLSGALTNAVYVVKPPKELPVQDPNSSQTNLPIKVRPIQLLLRIYGPQAEHLIDRDAELNILRRLARKRIGPCLLGTFSNGRFEEFLHAETLTAEDLRVPDTYKQIAKRMRELHDGIDLLEAELDAGPAVFIKWDKWVDRCEKVITWLDSQVHAKEKSTTSTCPNRYTKQGLVCGVEWPVFRKTFDKYRKTLTKECGGLKGVRKKLVFAHNDTQYGNLMRLRPSGESPLLQPSNQHKQLVVIDFEYASQNTIGIEFANHFTEWCYNYHHPELSYVCNTNAYPEPKQQYQFVRSYVMHRPQFNPTASATPKMDGREKTNISDFMLDARTPQGGNSIDYEAEEQAREKAVEEDIQRLLHETRLWRIANSAQWVAWGIVQAKVPELDEPPPGEKKSLRTSVKEKIKGRFHPTSDPLDEEEKHIQEQSKHDRPEGREQEEAHEEGDEEDDGDENDGDDGDDGEGSDEEHEEFDYLAYAHDRAMFFWGDCLQMGLIKEEDLPEQTRKQVKVLKY